MKILMVCLGNICRSPLAEGILAHKAAERGIDIEVDSAGTSGWHEGELPDARSIEVGLKYGVDLRSQRSRKLVQSDFQAFDIIYVMDASNETNTLALARNAEEEAKVKMILNESNPGMNLDVPDPYYGGDQGFENVYQMLDDACEAVLNKLS